MEKTSTFGTQINVHFISKSTTEAAIAFLPSEFEKRLKRSDTFHIVTDLNRDNESSPGDAGVRLLYEVRKLSSNQKCLIFIDDVSEGLKKLKRVLEENQLNSIPVTEDSIDLEQFVRFK